MKLRRFTEGLFRIVLWGVWFFWLCARAFSADVAPAGKSLFATPPVTLRARESVKTEFNIESSMAVGEREKAERDVQRWRALNGADLVSERPRLVETKGEKVLNYFMGRGGSFFGANPNAPPGRFTK